MSLLIWTLNLLLFSVLVSSTVNKKTHIILIVADDLGWNDVGFHGSSQIPTPNIDALAYSGVILNNYYVHPICTPSRGALLSGMLPIHTGLQHDVIYGAQPYGLPLKFVLLPKFLKKIGYHSHAVGKWHLGMYTKKFLPTFRGFDSHYGYWTGHEDYFSHMALERPGFWGYDFRRNMKVDLKAYGNYTTDLLNNEAVQVINTHNSSEPLFLYLAHLAVHSGNPYDPLQAPADIVKKFLYIKDEKRRKFAAMLWKLDEGVGQVVRALEAKGMLEDSVIVFTTDNGGPAAGFNMNAASNWPLRGVKAGLWEGGIRGAGLLWSPRLKNPGRVSMAAMHITDWLPTLYSAAGGNPKSLGALDGVDLWKTLVNDKLSSPRILLHNIEPKLNGAAVTYGPPLDQWKLVFNPSGYGPHWDGWFGPSGRPLTSDPKTKAEMISEVKNSETGIAIRNLMPNVYENIESIRKNAEVICGPIPSNATMSCSDAANPCLFHISSDPCEYYDVAKKNPQKVHILKFILAKFNVTAVSPVNKPWDPMANPKYWGYSWTNWKDYKVRRPKKHFSVPEEIEKYDHVWL